MTKRILAATGVMVVGLAAVQTAQAQQKIWNVSATLRGFYDDNYATAPSNPTGPGLTPPRSSLGFELSPSANVNFVKEQTSLTAGYTYSMKYYEDRPQDTADHSHQFQARLNHNFSPRYRLEVSESFAIAQEPQLLDPVTLTRPLRSEGDNMRNIAGFTFGADVTRLLGFEVGYQNSWYDYEQEGANSLSARLDRTEHLITLNSRWNIQPTTIGIFGYQFNVTEHSDSDQITAPVLLPPPNLVSSSTRDSRSHYLYVGADHTFTPQLTGSARVGGQYIEFPNAVPGVSDSAVSPYVDIYGSYSYGEGSYFQLGVKHNRSSTDVNNSLDQQATAVYGTVNHRITPKLTANLLTQYQYSEFNQGPQDGSSDNYFTVGLNLAYEINQYLTAETGYNYDRLDSDVSTGNRSYTRNRVYIGIRASY